MANIRKLVAGNWKMNGLSDQIVEAVKVADSLSQSPAGVRVAICPPNILVHRIAERLARTVVEVGAQDLHCEAAGAYTGDTSGEMLHDAGARLVIIGHSERRTHHREDDATVAAKVMAALRAGLEPIICVGESLAERESGRALDVVRSQLAGSLPDALDGRAFVVAYEPVWAIGTGLTPTLAEIEEVHRAIRAALVARFSNGAARPILYGGSVKASNASEILNADEVGGALVGGASLKASDFLPIVRAGAQSA
jgi:triosephosphate isomerase (TIM)